MSFFKFCVMSWSLDGWYAKFMLNANAIMNENRWTAINFPHTVPCFPSLWFYKESCFNHNLRMSILNVNSVNTLGLKLNASCIKFVNIWQGFPCLIHCMLNVVYKNKLSKTVSITKAISRTTGPIIDLFVLAIFVYMHNLNVAKKIWILNTFFKNFWMMCLQLPPTGRRLM